MNGRTILAALILFPSSLSFISPIQKRLRCQPPSVTRSTTMNANHDDVSPNIQNGAVTPSKKSRTERPSNAQLSSSSANPSTKGTIYVTVGPQCSGKTTILKRIFGDRFHKNDEMVTHNATAPQAGGIDITIDDQPLVYIPVPVKYFLYDGSSNDDSTGFRAGGISMSTELLGKTVHERIIDVSNDELRYVIRRLEGMLSAEDFTLRIHRSIPQLEEGSEGRSVSEDLIAAVEHIMASSSNETCLPDNVDLFIVESIFRHRRLNLIRNITGEKLSHLHSSSALDAALNQLKSHANDEKVHSSSAPMAWGNTNTRPREYTAALEAAKQSGRPVEFIVYGGSEACDMIREHMTRREYRKTHGDIGEEKLSENNSQNAFDQPQVLCLPKLSRLELLKRNLHRFLKTGRYIPSTAISDAMIRVESLLASAAAEAKKSIDPNIMMSVDDAKFYLDYELAKLADFELKSDRTVQTSTQNINTDGGRWTNKLNGNRSRYVGGGRFGRGHSNNGRGRNTYNDSQGRRYPQQGRQNGGRHSNFRQYNTNDTDRRHRSQYQRGQEWNNNDSRGRSQRGRGIGSPDYNNQFQSYNSRGRNGPTGRGPQNVYTSNFHAYNSRQGRGYF